MKSDPRFADKGRAFWALVKLASETLGYSDRAARGSEEAGRLRRHAVEDLAKFATARGWMVAGEDLEGAASYIAYRAELLENEVRPSLMNREEAAAEYAALLATRPTWLSHRPLNKQGRGGTNFLSAMVNLVAERELDPHEFDDNPRALVELSKAGFLVHVLPRQMDGAYPSLVNPVAVWEVKEYYGTTTFGSRVADGVYETRLDGLEIKDLRADGDDVRNYVMVDDYLTWWRMGRSYLCRLIDMLHEGLVSGLFFGRQVLSQWPEEVQSFRLAETPEPEIRCSGCGRLLIDPSDRLRGHGRSASCKP